MATKLTKNESALENLAAESGVAIVVLDKSGTERSAANNNSICRDLYPSSEFGPKCAEFCGRALGRSVEAGGVIEYRCHAGLDCKALAQKKGNRELVTIFGRAFSSSGSYRQAAERAVDGDWKQFKANSFFENVIISTSPARVDELQRRIGDLDKAFLDDIAAKPEREATKEIATSEPQYDTRSSADPFESSLLNYRIETGEGEKQATDPFESSMVNVKLEPAAVSASTDIADREAWRSSPTPEAPTTA